MEAITIIVCALIGSLLSMLLSCLPGMHVYSVLAVCVLVMSEVYHFPSRIFVPFYTGLVASYSVFGVVPAILMSAPDETAFFAASPGRKYLRSGRGYEAAILMGAGSLAGLFWLCAGFAWIAPIALGVIISVLRPHMHWIVWCVILFMLLSEWPKEGRYAYGERSRLADAWLPLLAGLATFLLSGLMGLILFFRSPICLEGSFQNLMPAFAGLFTLPWLVINIASSSSMPSQEFRMGRVDFSAFCSGVFAGILGGNFAAILPGVTGGVGGFLAGHATALRNDKAFLVSQGASRSVYYMCSLAILFVPAMTVARGGAASMVLAVYTPANYRDYYMFLASVAAAASMSILFLDPVVRLSVGVIQRLGYRCMALLGILIVTAMVFAFTGFEGLLVMFAALCIGMVPILYGVRRMNCLGVVLLPIAVLL